jgi:WD40 repeat protein
MTGEVANNDDENVDSLIAAAGSNGIVAIWNARQLLFSQGNEGSSTLANQQPEAILSQHTRAVNSLAWHPKQPGLLLTASQVRRINELSLPCTSLYRISRSHMLFYNSCRMLQLNCGKGGKWPQHRTKLVALDGSLDSLVKPRTKH